MVRLQAAVEVPKVEILLGANYDHVTGKPYASRARVRLPQGSQQIYIEPLGTRRIANSGILDLRVSKIFRFGETGRFEIIGDFLNLTNDQAPQNIISRQYNSPNFEQPSFWPTPRRIMIGLKFA